MEIIGEKITLRQVEEEEVDELVKIINEPDIRFSGDSALPFPIRKQSVLKYVGLTDQVQAHVYGIFAQHSDTIVGSLAIHNLDLVQQNCEVGLSVSKKYQGQGYGSEAIQLILSFLFENTPIHKIKLNVFAFNTGAIRLYEKLGFHQDGVLREEIFKAGKFHDVYTYSLLRQEWKN